MENIQIARILLEEVRGGRLEPSCMQHFLNSLQFGAPVPNPKKWLEGISSSMPEEIMPKAVKDQIRSIADRWDTLAENFVAGAARPPC